MGIFQFFRLGQNADGGSDDPATLEGSLDDTVAPEAMSASEQMYYFDAPLAHVVDYEDRLRMSRCEKTIRVVNRSRRPTHFAAPRELIEDDCTSPGPQARR